MHNELFKIGPVTIYGYGLMIGTGVLFALITATIRAKKRSLNLDILYGMALTSLIFGFIGAKLLLCITELKSFIANPMQYISGNGFVVYGGIIGGILAAIIFCRLKKVRFWDYFDLAIPSVALAQGFGRIGCFLAGCCYGKETDSFIGVIFHNSANAPNGIKLIPTQLISSAGDFIIFAILILYAKKERSAGKVGALYLILYSIGRFLIEFLRNDYRGSIGVLSTSQFICLFILVIGIIIFNLKNVTRIIRKQTKQP